VQTPITLKYGGRTREVLTEDVSFRGLFARTDDPPQLRELIQIQTKLPPNDTPFASQGMTVWVIAPSEAGDRVPGAGIQFYAMGPQRTKWEAFIVWAKRTAEVISDDISTPGAHEAPDPVRRKHPRYPIRLAVRPRSLSELMTMYTRDVSAGGMFLTSDQGFEVGAILQLDVRHPESERMFSLAAVVRRRGTAQAPGVGVEFHQMTDAERQRFYEFIHSHIPQIDDLELVDADDPNLE
jgi:uncharacterized protein (TIGR02266 family)